MKAFTLAAFADEAGAEIEEQISALQENKIPSIELRGVGEQNITALTAAEAKELKKRLDDAGISVWSIGSPLGKISVGEEFAPHLEVFRHTLELAHILNAGNIRMFSFFCPRGEELFCRDIVFERLHQFCAAAQGSGVQLCHENEKGIYGDTAARCLDILQNFPSIRAVYDPANFLQCGEDTLEAWEMLEPYITYLHIKDVRDDGTVVPAGRGNGRIPELLRRYEAIGGSVLTLEPHLSVFKGLEALEGGEKSRVSEFAYPSQRKAFDAAVCALNELL